MCMAIAGIGLSGILSPVLGVVGAIQQGRAAQAAARAEAAQAETNANIMRMNAETSTMNAKLARQVGEEHQADANDKQRALRRKARVFMAEQENMIAGSGLAPGGSSESLLLDTLRESEEDARALRVQGNREGWMQEIRALNHERERDSQLMQAANFDNQAAYARAREKNAVSSAILSGVGGALSFAGSHVIAPKPSVSPQWQWTGYGPTSLIHPDRRFDMKRWKL